MPRAGTPFDNLRTHLRADFSGLARQLVGAAVGSAPRAYLTDFPKNGRIPLEIVGSYCFMDGGT
jgi:hypothetical protein